MISNIRNIIVFSIFPFTVFSASGADISFTGNKEEIVTIEPEKSTGLDRIYVAFSTDGLSAVFSDANATSARWYRYSNLGGGYAEEITGAINENGTSTLMNIEGDMGYIIEYGDSRFCFWLVDYSKHVFDIASVAPSVTQDCNETTLDIEASAEPIHYYSINGRQLTLPRDIEVSYYNLEWDFESSQYIQQLVVKNEDGLSHQYVIVPPVTCPTSFTVSGDRYLKAWGRAKEVESAPFSPTAVDCHTTATQAMAPEDELGSNQISTGTLDALGGSAPAEIEFRSFVSDAVIHYEWQFAGDPEFEYLTHRITEQDLTYTFTEEGTVYVRFIGSNADGSCEAYGDTYTINIGASELRIPNAFSPDGDGVNDVWRVGYRSLTEFKCWIFDRYGHEIYHFDNPSGGWDGKRGGKYVESGVYYYVIQAVGADGRKYKKGGDINILRHKNVNNNVTQE